MLWSFRENIDCFLSLTVAAALLRRTRPWPVGTDEQRDRNRNIKNTGNPLKRRQHANFTLNRYNVTVTDR
jgi:hypothetical protein